MKQDLLIELIKMLIWRDVKKEETTATNDFTIWDYVIVRSYYSGVIYGKYMWRSSDGIVLHESRRLWRWEAISGITLSEVAIHWLKNTSKVTEPANICITDTTVCEILKVTNTAKSTIDWISNYQP